MAEVRRAIAILILLGLSLPGVRVMAAEEWKELYLDAKEKDLKNNRFEEARRRLTQALAQKSASSLGERTYSLEFFDYFPNYLLGRAYMGLGRRQDAIASFKAEERQGLIQRKAAEYSELKRLLKEAEDRENRELVQTLRREFENAMNEATALADRDRIDDAITSAGEARARAANLDAAAQSRVSAFIESLRQKQRAKEAEAQKQRERELLQRDLAEARRLLNAGQSRDALVKFAAILSTDPGNADAREGQREAQARILATTTRVNRIKDMEIGRRLLDAGAIDQALPLLTEAAADPTMTEAVVLLRRAQTLSAQRASRLAFERRTSEIRREIASLIEKGDPAGASKRLNLLLGLIPGDAAATKQLAEIDERNARNTLDVLLGDREFPDLAFVAPKQHLTETYEDTITVSGVATDDRGLAQITFKSGAAVVGAADLTREGEGRTHTFDESIPLARGLNRVEISVKDRKGRSFEAVFEVDRKPTLVEHPYFYPLVGLCAVSLVGTGAGFYAMRRRRALRNRFNPYIAGAPVLSNAMFFGRKKLLSRVLNMIHANSLMITGDRRIGKTSFMHHLKMALAEDEGTEFKFFPVSVDLQGVPEQTFFHTMMSEIVDALDLASETLADLRFRIDNDDYDDRDFSRDLQRAITAFLEQWNARPTPFVWTASVERILEKIARARRRLEQIKPGCTTPRWPTPRQGKVMPS